MNIHKLIAAFLLSICFLFQGCVSSSMHMGNAIDPQKISQIQKGKTTITELISWFGPPQSKHTGSDGEMYTFSSLDMKTASGGPLSFIAMPTETKSERHGLTLNVHVQNGVVIDYNYSEVN